MTIDNVARALRWVGRYLQKKTVAARPNPPKEGRWWVANNRSVEQQGGYADQMQTTGSASATVDDAALLMGEETGAANAAGPAAAAAAWLRPIQHRDSVRNAASLSKRQQTEREEQVGGRGGRGESSQ